MVDLLPVRLLSRNDTVNLPWRRQAGVAAVTVRRSKAFLLVHSSNSAFWREFHFNFLSSLQGAVCSLLSLSPHEGGAVITRQQQTWGAYSLHVYLQKGLPIYAVLCPDWIERAGMPENLFFYLLHEQVEERHGLLTEHSITVIIVIRWSYVTQQQQEK